MTTWTTADEIAFLAGLGTHRLMYAEPLNRAALLASYLRTMDERVEWGVVDPGEVREAALALIDDEGAS